MNGNTINKRNKTDIGMGVQMSKKLQYNSPAPQGNKLCRALTLDALASRPVACFILWYTTSHPHPLQKRGVWAFKRWHRHYTYKILQDPLLVVGR